MTQLNTPYPSTAYLTGFLRSRGLTAMQDDLAIKLALRLLSVEGLNQLKAASQVLPREQATESVQFFLENADQYINTIDAVIGFLQGKNPTLAHRLCSANFLPEGPRFSSLDQFVSDNEGEDALSWAFGALGSQDRARHLATLYLNDLADVIRDAMDSRFEFVRYGESLARSQASFDALHTALLSEPTWVDTQLQALTLETIEANAPTLVLLSVPFPGSVYGALRIAQAIKQHDANIKICLGGGFVNTELRELTDPRVFDFVDYITLDAGELPVLALIEHLQGQRPRLNLQRTFTRVDGKVRYFAGGEADIAFDQVGAPTWAGLPMDSYLSLLDMLNPMHRLWSDGRWNKVTVAHGCYWKKCSFCDVSLDYISRYDAASADVLVDRMQSLISETGQSGFHLVDEAAPPKALKAMARELKKRQMQVSWWGNIRFEKTFTPELVQELADSGCIAMSGGLEVASDRLLNLMQKGVSVAQVARVTHALSQSGILVHAYLMYGFPTQTVQDTVDALEYVRQLFNAGCIQSGFWHRFTCTVHAPVGKNPEQFGVSLLPLPQGSKHGIFARNDVDFTDPSGVDHDALGIGLNKALYNYMHGIGLDTNVRQWFDMKVPRTTVPKDFIERSLGDGI